MLFGLAGLAVYTVFVAPSLFGGLIGYVNSYVIPSVTIGVLLLIAWGFAKYSEHHEFKTETRAEKEARHAAGKYTLWETFCHWIRALHDKTCPLITVVEDAPVVKKAPVEQPKQPEPSDKTEDSVIKEVSIDQSVMASTVTESNGEPTTSSTVEVKRPYVQDVKLYDDFGNYVPDPIEKNATSSRVLVFLAEYFPNFQIFLAVGAAILAIWLLSLVMAVIMEDNTVVYEKAACEATYDVKTQKGLIKCGEYKHEPQGMLTFVTKTVLLKQTPYCQVKQGTYTGSTDFDCEYK